MDEAEIIATIRDAVTMRDFEWDQEHCDLHIGSESFRFEDAIRAVREGDVIETDSARSRWLFCGKVTAIRQDARFHDHWIHVVAEYDEVVSLVTMYRPSLAEWRTERIRR